LQKRKLCNNFVSFTISLIQNHQNLRGWEIMDERLIDLVERWDELGWYDRKRIWWICFKHKHGITGKLVISLAYALSVIGVMIGEHHPSHKAGLLAIIVLLYFYTMLIDFLINRGKITK
jgi:hypothetical protein